MSKANHPPLTRRVRGLLKAALLAASLAAPPLQANPLLSVASAAVQRGAHFDITVAISGVDAAAGLGAWQFDLAFDPAIVRADNVAEGGFLASFGATLFGPGVIDNAGGLISLVTDAYIDLPPLPAGDGILAIVSFTALADGVSALTLHQAFLNYGDAVAAPLGGQVTVGGSAVPEPGAAGLAALALLLLAAQRPARQRPGPSPHPSPEPSP